MTDWRTAAKALREGLMLRSDPVGVSLHPDGKGLGAHAGRTTVCHMLLRSRLERGAGVIHASAADMGCVWGSSALGITASPPRLRGGMLYLGFVADLEAGAAMHEPMGMIGDGGKRHEAVSTYPLDLAPQDPDAIVIYLTPGRALRAVIAALHLKGGAILTPVTGQASVCASIARAATGQASLDIPCIGDRSLGLVGDDEMVMAFPASMVDDLLLGLERTECVAPYPYRPSTAWEPATPPILAPMPDEL